MAETPIASTLSAADLEDRVGRLEEADVQRPCGTGRGARRHPPAAPGAAAALIDLVDLERECCPWIQFDVGDGSVVTMTAEGDGEAVLAGMFLAG